jgi:hypothetical protein
LFDEWLANINLTSLAGNFSHSKLPSARRVTGNPASPSNLRASSGLNASPLGCG